MCVTTSTKEKDFSFDPLSDIAMDDLNFELIDEFLEKYDRRFITYFKRLWLNDE